MFELWPGVWGLSGGLYTEVSEVSWARSYVYPEVVGQLFSLVNCWKWRSDRVFSFSKSEHRRKQTTTSQVDTQDRLTCLSGGAQDVSWSVVSIHNHHSTQWWSINVINSWLSFKALTKDNVLPCVRINWVVLKGSYKPLTVSRGRRTCQREKRGFTAVVLVVCKSIHYFLRFSNFDSVE